MKPKPAYAKQKEAEILLTIVLGHKLHRYIFNIVLGTVLQKIVSLRPQTPDVD